MPCGQSGTHSPQAIQAAGSVSGSMAPRVNRKVPALPALI